MAVSFLLVYPPLTDPTCGCAALPTLAAFVRESTSHLIDCIDANLEAIRYELQPDRVAHVLASADQELWAWQRDNDPVDLSPKSRSMRVGDLLLGLRLAPEDPERAAHVFQNADTFFDYASYYQAALVLERWLAILSAPQLPRFFKRFSVRKDITEVNFRNLSNLLSPKTLEAICLPFEDYIQHVFLPKIIKGVYSAIGFSISYPEQLPFAIMLCREIRRVTPNTMLILGGATVSQLYKYSRSTGALHHIFEYINALAIGDGEIAISGILDAIAESRSLVDIPNVVCTENAGELRDLRYQDLTSLPMPDPSVLPLDNYLAPEPLVHYAPTRGCYWNRCTFCDYGCSDNSPTAPYRQRPLEKAVEDIRRLRQYTRYIYFSVDAIAPAYLGQLAELIADADLGIRWSAELRLDMPSRDDYYQSLVRSGCIAVSVGFESGSQRILNLIDKGVSVSKMIQVIRELSTAGISIQIMGFTGFPSETFEEAMQTINLLHDLRKSWVFGGLGQFELTSGAIVAKHPDNFGIQSLRNPIDDDLDYVLEYDIEHPSITSSEKEKIILEKKSLRHPFQLDRPYVGGVDSPHSLFYIEKYGSSVRLKLDEASLTNFKEDLWVVACGIIAKSEGIGIDRDVIFTDDGRVLECSPAINSLILLLKNPTQVRVILDRVRDDHAINRFKLLLVLRQLVNEGLVRLALPFEIKRAQNQNEPMVNIRGEDNL